MQTPEHLGYFEYHGVQFIKKVGNELIADCIFCGKESHFYANRKTGLWDCKHCFLSGGKSGFLKEVCNAARKYYNSHKVLSAYVKSRKIPERIFRTYDIHAKGNNPIFPIYDDRNRIQNIRTYSKIKKKWLSTKCCKSDLIGLQKLKEKGPVFICEGEWDLLSFAFLIYQLDEKVSVIAVPGAYVFKNEFCKLLKGRKIYLLYDNDDAGKKGMEKAKKMLEGVAEKVYTIFWPDSKPNGYDINDYVIDIAIEKEKPKFCYNKIIEFCENESKKSKPKKRLATRPTVNEIIDVCSDYLDINENLKNAIYLSLATVHSIQIPGPDPTWLFLVGPPGCGKTTILNLFRESDRCYFQSSLKHTSLVSGFSTPRGEDPSLIPKLNGKCLILKDFTEIVSKPPLERDQIFGVLRGGYDGHVERDFGNGQIVRYNSMFTILAGVTQDIARINQEAFGERFLKYNILTEDIDWKARQKAAMHQALYGQNIKEKVNRLIIRFIDYDYNLTTERIKKFIPAWFTEKLVYLGRLIGALRTPVPRHEFGGLRDEPIYYPDIETGTRPSIQLQRLGIALALIQGKKEIDNEIYDLIKIVAFNSVSKFTINIMDVIISNGKPHSNKDIYQQTGISRSIVDRHLTDMGILKLVDREQNKVSGKMISIYTPTKMIKDLWVKAL